MGKTNPDNRRTLVDIIHKTEKLHGRATALGEAARWSLTEEVKRLLADGVPVDSRIPPHEVTPLMLASQPSMARLLVKHGADINARDNQGRTALIWFLLGSFPPGVRYKYVKALLALGADRYLASLDGISPVDIAKEKGCHELSELLETPA